MDCCGLALWVMDYLIIMPKPVKQTIFFLVKKIKKVSAAIISQPCLKTAMAINGLVQKAEVYVNLTGGTVYLSTIH